MADAKSETDGETPKAGAAPAKSKKKLFIIIGAVIALLAAAGGGYYMFVANKGDEAATEGHDDPMAAEADKAHADATPPNYVDVPEMVVNLRTADGQSRFLKIHFMLSAASADAVPQITERLPAIRDALQPFLRELRPEDLAGSAAVLRVKEELLRRARAQVPPDTLSDVLIQSMVQQ